jgi:maleylacetoacetate isomerase
MLFHGYFRSSAVYRCRIAFNLKALTPDETYVHLRKGEQKSAPFSTINPQKLVPALTLDDGTTLTQSLAIIEWLDETQTGPKLLPADPLTRAKVRSFAQIIACDIHPLQNLRVLQYLKHELQQDQEGLDKWTTRWLTDGLSACESVVSRAEKHTFCFGETPSLADICLVPQMFSAERFNVELTHMPRLRAIAEACNALPAFANSHPSRQPDAEA